MAKKYLNVSLPKANRMGYLRTTILPDKSINFELPYKSWDDIPGPQLAKINESIGEVPFSIDFSKIKKFKTPRKSIDPFEDPNYAFENGDYVTSDVPYKGGLVNFIKKSDPEHMLDILHPSRYKQTYYDTSFHSALVEFAREKGIPVQEAIQYLDNHPELLQNIEKVVKKQKGYSQYDELNVMKKFNPDLPWELDSLRKEYNYAKTLPPEKQAAYERMIAPKDVVEFGRPMAGSADIPGMETVPKNTRDMLYHLSPELDPGLTAHSYEDKAKGLAGWNVIETPTVFGTPHIKEMRNPRTGEFEIPKVALIKESQAARPKVDWVNGKHDWDPNSIPAYFDEDFRVKAAITDAVNHGETKLGYGSEMEMLKAYEGIQKFREGQNYLVNQSKGAINKYPESFSKPFRPKEEIDSFKDLLNRMKLDPESFAKQYDVLPGEVIEAARRPSKWALENVSGDLLQYYPEKVVKSLENMEFQKIGFPKRYPVYEKKAQDFATRMGKWANFDKAYMEPLDLYGKTKDGWGITRSTRTIDLTGAKEGMKRGYLPPLFMLPALLTGLASYLESNNTQ
jgi:hypothetical protein